MAATLPVTVPEMQPQRYLSSWRPAWLTALVLGVLAGCASFPPATFPGGGGEARHDTGAGTPGSQAAAADAAAQEARARRSSGDAQVALQLQAARSWLRAGRGGEATRVLSGISGLPTPVQRIEREVLEADITLAAGQAQLAWQKMSAIAEPTGTALAPQYFDSRMRIALAAARPLEGVRSEMAAERLSATSAERSQLRHELLRELRVAREHGVKLDPDATQDATVRGWLDLGAMAGDSGASSINGAIEAARWRAHYPDHPASELLATALAAPLPTSGRLHKIALLLPVTGQASGYAAIIKSGFDFAWQQLPAEGRPQIQVYDTGVVPVNDALNQARSEGSDFIVGPLTRTEVDVAAASSISVPMLALNFLSAGRAAPGGMYQYALSPEEDARAVARRLLAAGQKRGVALAPTGDWGTRVLAAFTQELLAGGGMLVAQAVYDPAGHDFGAPIRSVLGTDQSFARRQRLETTLGVKLEFEPRSRADLNFVFAPGQAANLRLLRPQLRFQYAGTVPVYATADAYAVDGGVANQDLDGLIVPALPWLVPNSGSADAVRQAVQTAAGDNTAWQSSLYAFGYDACQLALAIAASGRDHGNVRVDGLSGQLTIDPAGRVHRDPLWARITRSGEPRIIAGSPQADATGNTADTGNE
jgi:outer membrane PBP1 activator LpoA protein